MFSKIRKRLTYTNVGVTLALVFAMTGGAYAASKYVITSTKQIKPSVLKQLQGKAGARGAQGPQGPGGATGASGPQGPGGATGASGPQGAAGGTGVSVTSKPLTASDVACKREGGSEFTAASGKTFACNGSPWTAGGVLPSGATETGTWEDQNRKEVKEPTTALISFSVPLKEAPTPHYIEPEEVELEKLPAGCKGTPAKPEAEPGNLCIFASLPISYSSLEEPLFFNPGAYLTLAGFQGNPEGASPYGTLLVLKITAKLGEFGETAGRGTWAVTGA
jgi:hypothetical protein